MKKNCITKVYLSNEISLFFNGAKKQCSKRAKDNFSSVPLCLLCRSIDFIPTINKESFEANA